MQQCTQFRSWHPTVMLLPDRLHEQGQAKGNLQNKQFNQASKSLGNLITLPVVIICGKLSKAVVFS